MKAMLLKRISSISNSSSPLDLVEIPCPEPADNEILVKVRACGVCHTELDEIEGRTPPPVLPVVPGHQVVGIVAGMGPGANIYHEGDRVGIGWIHSSCGLCDYCISGNENLCGTFRATGRDVNGGYAEYITVPEKFAFPVPAIFSDAEAAPLLCAGAIGYRSVRLAGLTNGERLGLTGFGASGHLVLKMVKHSYPGTEVFVFARSREEQAFALELGAYWAGDTEEESPLKLHCIIDTTPVWKPVVEAMKNLLPGGRLVINAIRKEDSDKDWLLKIDYPVHLWMEKEIKSVANVSRKDVSEFIDLAAEIGIKPDYQEYSLEDVNRALIELKNRHIRGAKVVSM